jgi:hypothetical protein
MAFCLMTDCRFSGTEEVKAYMAAAFTHSFLTYKNLNGQRDSYLKNLSIFLRGFISSNFFIRHKNWHTKN